MKKKFTLFLAAALCLCFALASCADPINSLEGFCFSVSDFDLEKASSFVDDSAEKYFERALSYEKGFSEEQREIAEELYASFVFTDFSEVDGKYYVTVKYVDFYSLIKDVDLSLAMGIGSASEHIRDIISSGRLASQFMKTEKNVPVTLCDVDGKAKIPFGYSSENKRFTEILGFETFFGWYSTKR